MTKKYKLPIWVNASVLPIYLFISVRPNAKTFEPYTRNASQQSRAASILQAVI